MHAPGRIPYCYLLSNHKVSIEITCIYEVEAGSRKKVISHLRTRIAPGRGGPGPLGQGAVTGGTRPLALPCTCPLFQINVTEQKRLVSIQKNCGIVVISFDCYTHLPQLQQHTTAIHLAGLACVNEPSLLGSILSHWSFTSLWGEE